MVFTNYQFLYERGVGSAVLAGAYIFCVSSPPPPGAYCGRCAWLISRKAHQASTKHGRLIFRDFISFFLSVPQHMFLSLLSENRWTWGHKIWCGDVDCNVYDIDCNMEIHWCLSDFKDEEKDNQYNLIKAMAIALAIFACKILHSTFFMRVFRAVNW